MKTMTFMFTCLIILNLNGCDRTENFKVENIRISCSHHNDCPEDTFCVMQDDFEGVCVIGCAIDANCGEDQICVDNYCVIGNRANDSTIINVDVNVEQPAEPQVEEELCDGEDNDHDGLIDEDFAHLLGAVCYGFWEDGSCTEPGVVICASLGLIEVTCTTAPMPGMFVLANEPEVCDGLDNNCDGIIDEGCTSFCGDGLCETEEKENFNTCPEDCSVVCEAIYDCIPGAFDPGFSECPNCGNCLEIACISGMCALLPADLDGDGHSPDFCGREFDDDCDYLDPSIHPGAQETCDGKDNNCDGETDEAFTESLGQECFGWLENGHCTEPGIVVCNEPGQVAQLACTTADPPTLYTTADYPAEFCDGKDNNCDGQIDEGCGPVCGNEICEQGELPYCPQDCQSMSEEQCDGLDNNNNGTIDEGCYIGEAVLCHSDEDCVDAPWGPFCVYSILLEVSFCQACLQDVLGEQYSVNGVSPGCGDDLPVCAWGGTEVPVTDFTPDGMVSFYWCDECGDQMPCPDGQLCIFGECVTSVSAEQCDGQDNDGNGTVDEGCQYGEAVLCDTDDDCVDAPWGPFCVWDGLYDNFGVCQQCTQQGGASGCSEDKPICIWGSHEVPPGTPLEDMNAPLVPGTTNFYWCVQCTGNINCGEGMVCDQETLECVPDPFCQPEPWVTFSVNTPSGLFAPGPEMLVAVLEVQPVNGNAVLEDFSIHVYTFLNPSNNWNHTWTWSIKDESDMQLSQVFVQEAGTIVFPFDYDMAIPQGQVKTFFIYADTTQMSYTGDGLLVSFIDSCGNELTGGTLTF